MNPYQWLDLNRDHNGNIDARAAMAVRREMGWSQKQVQEAAERHRNEEQIRMRSTFVGGTYDLLHTAHRWGQDIYYLASVLELPVKTLRGWFDKWNLPVPDDSITDSDKVTFMMNEKFKRPKETVWQFAGIAPPDEWKRPSDK